MKTSEIMIDEMVRDVTTVIPKTKSLVRSMLIEFQKSIVTATEKEYYALGRSDTEKIISGRVGQLRQWLNEKPESRVVTNEDILYWLGLCSEEEMVEARKAVLDNLPFIKLKK